MNLGYPSLSRIELAKKLCNDAALSYRTKLNRDMTPMHQKLVFDSITWAVCECRKENRKMNDVFRRAAIIALWWTKGAPNWQLFGVDSLLERLHEFLHYEGADLAPSSKSNPRKVQQDIESILDVCKNPDWARTCSNTTLLKDIQHEIAKHWVCSESNHRKCFRDKGCHG